jgi:clorobiocin biosynthesis protein CloN6
MLETGFSLPIVSADLLLIHAPAFFDFRDRRDIYFPYLSTSGDVPITPLYEYFPLGFKSLQHILADRGFDVKIVNLSSVLLKYPKVDVSSLIQSLNVRLFGIDLHWMVHVQGSLAIAALLKQLHPETPVIFGGISSTYYANELIRYPSIDMVMRGYDTHAPMARLLEVLGDPRRYREVQNLLWKDRDGAIVDNSFSYKPRSFSCGVDWSSLPRQSDCGSVPILEVLSTQNAGCTYNCGWCGGSREAFRRINEVSHSLTRKPLEEISLEFSTMARIPNQERHHFYAVGSYTETRERFNFFLDHVARSNFKSISYEQFRLADEETLCRMATAHKRTVITLSPESHDLRVAKLAGRGIYTMDEMERWITKALNLGIYEIDVWFFVGMPEQDEKSVAESVEYCGRLLKLFKGCNVIPLLCPMIPFLDPGCNFFEQPERHGYRVFYRTAQDHEEGMQRASLLHRINYETAWLSRADLVRVGYKGVRRLTELKVESRVYPRSVGATVCQRVDEALEFIPVVHEIDSIADLPTRRRELEKVGDEIRRLNHRVFFSGVGNQAFPVMREIGGRWFDEMLWDADTLDRYAQAETLAASGAATVLPEVPKEASKPFFPGPPPEAASIPIVEAVQVTAQRSLGAANRT